jgi:enoyl-CoA hydratase/carnithine racemase
LRLGLVDRVAPAAATQEAALELAAEVATHPPEAVARLKRLLHDWDDVEGRSRAEGEGQIEWQRSGPGPPLRGLMARLQGRRRRPCDSAGNE